MHEFSEKKNWKKQGEVEKNEKHKKYIGKGFA
jgi:hypothetical protein